MRTLIPAMLALAAVVSGCQRAPGRDVTPMRAWSGDAVSPSLDVIPIDKVSKSQAAIVGQRVANTEFTITYSRPVARGRELFGGIVPYGEAWNPGADQATAVSITRDIRIEGHPLAAGKYSIWMIPRPDLWTIILSRAAEVYHTPYPGEGGDALRFDLRPQAAAATEVLTFEFSLVEGKVAQLLFRWGTVAIPMQIEVP